MKTLAITLMFTLLATASLQAQRSSGVDGWNSAESGFGFRGSHFNDFAVNGKFYHDITLYRLQNGVAELDSKEGRVSTAWDNLPHVFQHAYANVKANADAQEAKKPKAGTAPSGADRPPVKLVGMSQAELTGLFGPPTDIVADPVFTGCLDLTFWAKSLVDGQPIGIQAIVMDGTCLGITYVKTSADKFPLANQEIARWMLIYTQGTAGKWRQNGPDKWVLDRGAGVPYTYRASRIQPNTFSIDTQELFDHVRNVEQQAKSDVQRIPGLSASPSADRKVSDEVRIPGLDEPRN